MIEGFAKYKTANLRSGVITLLKMRKDKELEESIIRSGTSFGFHVFRVYEPDDEWVQKVLDEAERVRNIERRQQAYRILTQKGES